MHPVPSRFHEPGRYSILARPPSRKYSRRGSYQQSDEFLPTYYSGTTDSARASTLEVKSGDEISGIDFVFAPKPPTRTYKVRGHVLNPLTEYPNAIIEVLLLRRGNRDLDFFSDQKYAIADAKTGNFEIKDVMPGEYFATAISLTDSTSVTTQNVDVVASDIDGVSLVLTRGIDIPVRVEFEGKFASAAADVAVSLDPSEDESGVAFGRLRNAVTQPDGSFLLKGVGDGSYSVRVSSKCGDCYLKSATAYGVDLLDQGVQVTSGAGLASMAIVYSSNSGTVTGAVSNKDDLPAPGAMVVVVPQSGSHHEPEQYKTSTTDPYGRFEIRGVPPGHYKAFAWEKVDKVFYGDPDFLRLFETMAESFDIAANEQKTVKLKMISAADSAN